MAHEGVVNCDTSSWASDILRCNICYDKFTRPRVLPCLHSFCEPCLQRHIEFNTTIIGGNFTFACPTCREKVSLPQEGVSGFRRDFRVTQLQDLIQQSRITAEQDLFCQFCDDRASNPQYFCKDCCKFLCFSCTTKHKEKVIFQEHQVMDRRQTSVSAAGETCRTHRNEQVQYICQTCHLSICSLCVMTSFHDDHNVLDMSKGLRHYVDSFTVLYEALTHRSGHLHTKLATLSESEEDVRLHRTATARKIKDRVDSLIEHVHKQERKLLTELDRKCNIEMDDIADQQKVIELSVCEMTNIADLCSSFAEKPPLSSMVPIYGDLCERIERLLDESEVHNTEEGSDQTSRSSIDFTPGSRKPRLGRLFSGETGTNGYKGLSPRSNQIPVCERISSTGIIPPGQICNQLPQVILGARFGRFGNKGGEFHSPRDVAFLRNGSFVVADTNNNRLQIFSPNGLLVNVIGEGQIKPWGVAVTQEGHIGVTDNFDKCIKVYRPNGVLVSKIGKLLCPCGIAVNRRGEFVVTDFFSTYGYVLDRTGALIKKFEVRSVHDQHTCGASRVAVDKNGLMVISDISNACLKVFDEDGKFLRIITSHDHLVAPQGVCFDQYNNVLVADALKQDVVVFTCEGEHLGHLIGTKHRLRDATGLAVSLDGYMAVTQLKSNQVKLYTLTYQHFAHDTIEAI